MRHMRPFQALHVSHNQIGDAGVTALASACAGGASPQLKRLHLGGNPASQAAQQAAMAALKDRK